MLTSALTRGAAGPLAVGPRARVVVVRSGDVQDLIARDRKPVELNTAAFEPASAAAPAAEPAAGAAQPEASTSSPAQPTPRPGKPGPRKSGAGPKPRRVRQADLAKAAEAAAGGSDDAPSSSERRFKRCKEAIDAGLSAFEAKDYAGAIDLFNLALELPGNGAYRMSGSPREYACPSDAEEHAALYNMACCYAQLGQKAAALTCLEAILETGFNDVATLRSDPDLRPLQGAELQALIGKYTGVGGLLTNLLKRDKVAEVVADPNKPKSWLTW